MFTLAIAGCGSTPAATSTTNSIPRAPSTSASPEPASSDAGFDVQSLGVTFTLPASFRTIDEPSLVFIARSTDPPAVFSIDHGSVDVTTYDSRPGEGTSTVDLAGLRNVVVTNSAVSGLPAGIDSNKLLVSNGERSFSVIMSAPAADLPPMWQTFITSIEVAAA